MFKRSSKDVLLDTVALAFPLDGGISELVRRMNASYEMSFHNTNDDPKIADKDKLVQMGHLRRSYINQDLLEFAKQYPASVAPDEKMEGDEGYNNHVELEIGNFLVTHHHHTRSSRMPNNFINLDATYNRLNSALNDPMQEEMFSNEEIVSEDRRKGMLNLLIMHEKSSDHISQIGNVEFVFPKKSIKFISLKVSELAQKQSEILELTSEDLFDFKRKSFAELRKLIG